MTPEQKALIKEWLTITQFIGPKSHPPGPGSIAWSAIQEQVEKAFASNNELDRLFYGQQIYRAYSETLSKSPLGAAFALMGSMHPGEAVNIGYVAGILYGLGLVEAANANGDKNLQAMVDTRKAMEESKPIDFNAYRKAPRV